MCRRSCTPSCPRGIDCQLCTAVGRVHARTIGHLLEGMRIKSTNELLCGAAVVVATAVVVGAADTRDANGCVSNSD